MCSTYVIEPKHKRSRYSGTPGRNTTTRTDKLAGRSFVRPDGVALAGSLSLLPPSLHRHGSIKHLSTASCLRSDRHGRHVPTNLGHHRVRRPVCGCWVPSSSSQYELSLTACTARNGSWAITGGMFPPTTSRVSRSNDARHLPHELMEVTSSTGNTTSPMEGRGSRVSLRDLDSHSRATVSVRVSFVVPVDTDRSSAAVGGATTVNNMVIRGTTGGQGRQVLVPSLLDQVNTFVAKNTLTSAAASKVIWVFSAGINNAYQSLSVDTGPGAAVTDVLDAVSKIRAIGTVSILSFLPSLLTIPCRWYQVPRRHRTYPRDTHAWCCLHRDPGVGKAGGLCTGIQYRPCDQVEVLRRVRSRKSRPLRRVADDAARVYEGHFRSGQECSELCDGE